MSSPLSQEAGELISHVYMSSPLSQEAGELISHVYMSSPLSQEAGELGGLSQLPPKFAHFFVPIITFFSLSSVQIIIIPACCLLCVL